MNENYNIWNLPELQIICYLMIQMIFTIYICANNVFLNRLSFTSCLFNDIIFIIKCIMYSLMYYLSTEEIATNMYFG